MSLNKNKILIVFLMFFIAGIAVLLADEAGDNQLAFVLGYLKGYSSTIMGTTSNSELDAKANSVASNTGYPGSPSSDSDGVRKNRVRQTFIYGFKQGFQDKENGRENRFLDLLESTPELWFFM